MLADTPLPRGFGAALASVDTFFPRAPEQFVTSPLCVVGYVRWDARSDRVPPLQTIIFSSFPGRTKGCRLERSRWRGGRFACTSPIRRWSLERLTVVRYDDVNMDSDVSSISMSINNGLLTQLLSIQQLPAQSRFKSHS